MSVGRIESGRVVLRDLQPKDVAPLIAMRRLPEIAQWWGRGADDWPTDMTDGEQLIAIEIDGELAGHIELYEEIADPDWRFATLDIFIAPQHIGHGHGTNALSTLIDFLIAERGHHRITIDPAIDNVAAVRSYEKVGFRPIGQMEKYWRDQDGNWRDSLFMELVVEPPQAPR